MVTWAFSPSRTIIFKAPCPQNDNRHRFAQTISILPGKMPFDSFDYLADFSNVLPLGDTVASIVEVVQSPSDLVIGEEEITSGMLGASMAVGMRLSAGTPLLAYSVTIAVLTAYGNACSRTFTLPILNGPIIVPPPPPPTSGYIFDFSQASNSQYLL